MVRSDQPAASFLQCLRRLSFTPKGLYVKRLVALARLVPSLRSLLIFDQACRSVDRRFQLISSNLRGGPGTVDLAMRMKGEHDADYHSWHFAPELIIPVCSPSYLAQHKPLLGVPGESGHSLLHLSDAHFDPKTLWGATTAPIARHALFEFSDYAVVLQAALSGGGAAH